MSPLNNLSTEYSFGSKSLKSSCKLKHSDSGVSLKLKHGHPGNKLGFELGGKLWEASYDLKSKDAVFERKWNVKGGELKMKQKVPAGNFALIPSPSLQWKSKLVNTKALKWEIEPSYCMQTRTAKIETEVEVKSKAKFKLEYAHKTGSRPLMQLSLKPGSKWAKQVGIKGTGPNDARLTLDSEPSKKTELKASIGRQLLNDVQFKLEVKPGKVAGVKPKLTLESRLALKSRFVPSGLIAGLSLDC